MNRIIRWNPVVRSEVALDRLFDDAWRSIFAEQPTSYSLALDLDEHDTAYVLKANLPGVDPEKISIRLEDDVLTIEAELNEETEKKEGRALVRERRYGKFSRSVRLPQLVDGDAIEATYENGVLQLNVPKLPEIQPKQITVKVGNGNGNNK